VATPTVVTFGGITMTGPFSATDNYVYFALTITDSGITEVVERWRYIGHNGSNLKLMGTGPRFGQIIGWIDAASAAHQKTAEEALTALVTAKTIGSITFITGPEVTNGMFNGVTFPSRWGHDSRFCTDFIIAWEKLG